MTNQPTKKQQTEEAKEHLSAAGTEDAILQDLLANIPVSEATSMELPSQNKFYKLTDPAAPITIRPMTFEDEKAMMSNKNPNVDVLNTLLTRCVSNVPVADILQIDKLYIIMKLRAISYGDTYQAMITCPSCRSDNKVQFDLSDLNVVNAPDDMTNPIEVFLPVIQKTAKVRLPRISDEGYFKNSEIATKNMWRFVEEIEGHTSMRIISKVIEKLPLKDAHILLKALGGNEIGIDTKVRFACNYCSHSEVMELPITADFFTEN